MTSNTESPNVETFGYHLRALDSLTPLRLQRRTKRVTSEPDVVLAIVKDRPLKKLHVRAINDSISRGVIVPISNHYRPNAPERGPFDYRGKIVWSSHINFPQLRSWIDECKYSDRIHRLCNSISQRGQFTTRVLDCLTRRMVLLEMSMEYLALSYVWGHQTAIDNGTAIKEMPHLLPSPAPRTIEDAITVVQALYKRYLWVDRYCIWESEDKHLQIQNMDQIYRNALCTIVAVDGDSSESGLCGISSPRSMQPRVQIGVSILVTTLPHLSQQLSKSVWATRGWTYQEAVLSRRCLFFTKDQVYFACRTMLRCEAVSQSPTDHLWLTREFLGASLMKVEEQLSFRLSQTHTPSFAQHLKEYTSRALTFDSDALNAFKGTMASQDEYSYWGVPITKEIVPEAVNVAFARSLVWRGTGHPPKGECVRRRREFPTWSWTSLVDQVMYLCANPGFSEYHPIFYVENQDRDLIPFMDIYRYAIEAKQNVITEQSKYLHIEGYVVKVRLQSTNKPDMYNKSFRAEISIRRRKWGMASIDEQFAKESGKFRAHLLSEHLGHEYSSGLRPRGKASIDLPNDKGLCTRFDTELWDAVHLLGGDYWMLLDWNGPTARRIGMITLDHGYEKDQHLSQLPTSIPEKRMIRLE